MKKEQIMFLAGVIIVFFFFGYFVRMSVEKKTPALIEGTNTAPKFEVKFEAARSYNPKKRLLEADAFWQKDIPKTIADQDTASDGSGGMVVAPTYIARADTANSDSSFKASMWFTSPTPLHPASRFGYKFSFGDTPNIDEYRDRINFIAGVRLALTDLKLKARLLLGGGYKFINTKHYALAGEYNMELKTLSLKDVDHSITIKNILKF